MTTGKANNFLRASRKKAGLSQRELAFLLGSHTAGYISRYERRKRMPSIETALGCEAALGIPVSELFAETYQSVATEVKERARKMSEETQVKGLGRATAEMSVGNSST
jgi:transcriptional regulator with XRE-family HTH domain